MLKVLVHHHDNRPGGFTWTTEGELMMLSAACCNAKTCGCGRSFSGFDSRKATTLARVEERDITRDDYIALYRASEERAGFAKFIPDDEMVSCATHMLELADFFETGSIIEKTTRTVRKAKGTVQ